MAATGYTPISLYYSTTATQVPTNTNLVNGELAINITDGKLYYKDNTGAVQLLAASSSSSPVLSFSAGTTGFTPSTSTSGAITLAGTLVAANGGTGQSSYAVGDLLYASGTTALSKLGVGSNGQVLTLTGGVPTWAASTGGVTSFSAGTTGLTPNTSTTGAITLGGTLDIDNGGTGQTTASAAFNALSPVTTAGDLIIGNGANSSTRLPIGADTYVLTSNGTTATWAASTGSGAGTITRTDFTATASQTVFTVTYPVGLIDVYRNGVKLAITDFTATNGTSFTLATGANAGDLIQAEVFNALNLYQTITTDTFSGNGSTTVFTMSVAPANAASTLVAISGVIQDPASYTVSSTTLTFSAAPPTGTGNISVRYLGVTAATPGSGGQFFGNATVKAIAYNANSIAEDLTVTTGNNGYSAGPITLEAGYSVTVEPGSRWVII